MDRLSKSLVNGATEYIEKWNALFEKITSTGEPQDLITDQHYAMAYLKLFYLAKKLLSCEISLEIDPKEKKVARIAI